MEKDITKYFTGKGLLGTNRFRKSQWMQIRLSWAALGLFLCLAIATGLWWVFLGLIAPVWFIAKNGGDEKLAKEENDVLESLRYAANYNIDTAKYNAENPDSPKSPLSLHSNLESDFGREWISELGENEVLWMKEKYDEMIEFHTQQELKISKSKDHLDDLGDSEQRQLEAYYAGRKELENPTLNDDPSDPDSFNWYGLVEEQNKNNKKEGNH